MEMLSTPGIVLRLCMATIFAGIIGIEREVNSRPAGIRTHILVCVGAAIVAMIQLRIMETVLVLAREEPTLAGVIRADPARLICQVISGVGFLGAGTIVITKNAIRGLTTAASLWATAGLGLAIGMGYYALAVSGCLVIFLVLTILKRIIHIHVLKKIRIKYIHREETREFILRYFQEHHIYVRDSDFNVDASGENRIYTSNYTVDIPNGLTYTQMADDLCENSNIQHISLINM